jgi:hypothetical protein
VRGVFSFVLGAACVSASSSFGQPDVSRPSQGMTRVCVISFGKDPSRPARVEDSAAACLLQAKQMLAAHADASLYLVGAADKIKDNAASHGHQRAEQDMTGEDLRYADVAAYRAINTKAYLATWLSVNPTRIVPVTTYEDGQWVALYLVTKNTCFKRTYSKETAPILSRPCTVKPCATGPEEFLLAQPRERITGP